jgi:DNA gyrase subunit A
VLISITQRGYIKRVAASTYRTQARGGRGVTGQAIRQEDESLILMPARTLQTLLFFSDRGKVYSEKVYQIPDANRTDRGIPLVNILSLEANERITAAVAVPDFEAAGYCSMATLTGRMKRVALSEFANVRPSGLIAITLDQGDELGWVRLTHGNNELIMVTAKGQALRCAESVFRAMGRQAAGVTGIGLKAGDRVASMEVVEPGGYLVVVTEKGFGKRVKLSEYPAKGRATGGVTTIDHKSLDKIGKIAVARVMSEDDETTLISRAGLVLRIKVKDISESGRTTRGVRLMAVGEGDSVASLARISSLDLK